MILTPTQGQKPKTRFDGRIDTGKDEWLTPPYIIQALGQFDLDPCAPIKRPWPMAKHHYTIRDNGLVKPWFGRVWCNPPYGDQTERWLNRMAHHNNGIALVYARTDTQLFFGPIWPHAAGLLFIEGRLKFFNADGSKGRYTGGAPSVLVAYGEHNAIALLDSGIKGAYVSMPKMVGYKPEPVAQLSLDTAGGK